MEDRQEILRQLMGTLQRINDTNAQITGIVNNFAPHYEVLAQYLNIVTTSNKLLVTVQDALQQVKEEGLLEDDETLAQRVEDVLRTQEWTQKNAALAEIALKKLSDLEDITLQFYDNPHPDVVFD